MVALHDRRIPLVLGALLLAEWAYWAIAPPDRLTWLAENALVFAAAPVLVWTYFRFRLSNLSYALIFLFLSLHLVGAHTGYSNVPYEWAHLGTERNHYDRIVHFSFGLLMAYPIREVFHRIAHARGFWGYYLPLDVTLAFSALYEVLEWLFALAAGPEQGAAFLGSQGDEFDAVKDMALAGSGAFLAMLVTMLVAWRLDPSWGREMRASLRIGKSEPMGERRLLRWKARRKKE